MEENVVLTIPDIIRPGQTVALDLEGFVNTELQMDLYVGAERIFLQPRLDGSDGWATTWKVPDGQPLGQTIYQVWATSFFSEVRVISQGLVDVLPSLVLQQKSGAEVRLEQVDKAIDRLVRSGIQSYTLAGNNTTRMSLEQLRRERQEIVRAVNRERQAAGLPLVDGTEPAFQARAIN